MTALTQQLDTLGHLLRQHANLWRPQPFTQLELPWQREHPELAAWLDGLPEAALSAPKQAWLGGSPQWLQELARELAAASALPDWTNTAPTPLGAHAARGMPGRKVKQIEHFCAAVLPRLPFAGGEVVDWCAGKGHLGRTLIRQTGGQLTALERDEQLVAAGQKACDHLGLPARFVACDVLGEDVPNRLNPQQIVVALHACGDLHAALLAAATSRHVAGLALAPCCYNLATAATGFALSAHGRKAQLQLTASDLDLLHRDPQVANGTDISRAHCEQAWRLALDLLQRDVTGVDQYRTLPPFPRPWLRLEFAEFCRRLAAQDGLQIPNNTQFSAYELLGWQRFEQVRRRDLLRGLFRAPLESWLVLDRAQVLAEAGYQVEFGYFCAREVTPRRALIVARHAT